MSILKSFLIGLKTGIRSFGLDIANTFNTVLLLLVYIVGVGLTSIIAKIINKHFLETTYSTDHDTYWQTRQRQANELVDHFHQF